MENQNKARWFLKLEQARKLHQEIKEIKRRYGISYSDYHEEECDGEVRFVNITLRAKIEPERKSLDRHITKWYIEPVKAGSAKKEEAILIRMSKAESKGLKRQASDLGLSVSAYIRMLIHQKEKKWFKTKKIILSVRPD